MADINIQVFSLADDAAPTQVGEGRGLFRFSGNLSNLFLSGASGSPFIACPGEIRVDVETPLYLAYRDPASGTNPPRDVTVMFLPAAPTAVLSVNCGG